MEMLVSSLDEIKSTELVICRFACCGRNELVALCDPSDRTNHKITCPKCNKEHEIDMNPVFTFGLNSQDEELYKKDNEILTDVQKVNNKFKVV
jgi:hypothetical protein